MRDSKENSGIRKYIQTSGLTLVLISTLSCSKNEAKISVFWNGQGPMPKVNVENFTNIVGANLKSEKIEIRVQEIDGAEVEGAFLKTISSNDKISYLAAQGVDSISPALKKQVLRMGDLSATVVPQLQVQNADFKDLKYYQAPKVILRMKGKGSPVALWKVSYFDKDGWLLSTYVDSEYKIVETTHEGSGFADALALVFPEGPSKSDVGTRVLKNLTGDGSLTSRYLTVVSESSNPARGENEVFNFPMADERFDQVQVFFFISRALSWFENTLGVRIPFAIKAVVHIGYPEKTNTAFYYSGQIRIGKGDDKTYSSIPLDPTIILHESGHALVDSLAKLPFQGEGGSINEGFADFFAAVQLKNPNMGDQAYKAGPFKRTLANNLKVTDKNSGLYHDSGIISGTLWSIKNKIGDERATWMAVKILSRLNPASDFNFFRDRLLEVVANDLNSDEQAKVQSVLTDRGWK